MMTSDFQFSNPLLTAFNFHINHEYNAETEEVEVGLKISVSKKRTGEREAIVELTVEIGEKDDSTPFYINATEGAFFKWEENAFNGEKDIDVLLDVNAPALLLSYLRPIVAGITTASKYSSYNIPFINFNKTKKEA